MVALDSNVFIYLLNAHPEFGPKAERAVRSSDEKVACELVYAEVFSSPKLDSAAARTQTKDFMEALRISYMPISKETNLLAGQLRRTYKSLTLADALHVACAIQAGADTFVTNDQVLTKLNIPGLTIKLL